MFIELTKIGQYDYIAKILINLDDIISVRRHDPVGAIIERSSGDVMIVEESYEEVKDMITREPAAIVHVGTRELDQLYEDADKGICSNSYKLNYPENMKIDVVSESNKINEIMCLSKLPPVDQNYIDELKARLYESIGVPRRYLSGKVKRINKRRDSY